MDKKKKAILIVVIGVFVLALTVALYFVFKSQTNSYPKEAIKQESLNSATETIALGDTKIEASDGYLYTVSKTVMLEEVRAFVKSISPKSISTIEETGIYYEWKYGDDYVIYELDQNTVIFSFEKGITWNEAGINGYSFTQFVKNYFGKNWIYSTPISDKQSKGEIVYYTKRIVEGLDVEMISNRESTDYLAIKDSKIVYGKILLTDFVKVEGKLPLISSADLNTYVNLSSYPKEIHPNYAPIQATVLESVDYKSDDFDKIIKTISNCKSSSSDIIYLYKSLNQGNLTPVYKLDLQCEITYKEVAYTIPAIGYVNAIDPKYISTAE